MTSAQDATDCESVQLHASAHHSAVSPLPHQDATDCESVQFVSGMLAPNASTLLMSYGVNDCEARLGALPMSKVWEMLRPVNVPNLDPALVRACWPPGPDLQGQI